MGGMELVIDQVEGAITFQPRDASDRKALLAMLDNAHSITLQVVGKDGAEFNFETHGEVPQGEYVGLDDDADDPEA